MTRDDVDRNFGVLVHDVARLMRTAFDRRGRELGLTRSQWWLLTSLYVNEGCTQSELADFMEIEKATVGRLLDRLEEKDWVERRPDEVDRRVKRVFLTERVQGLMRQLRRIAADLRRDALAGVDEVERDRLVDTLIRIKGNIAALDDDRAGAATRRILAAADD
jgi:MarR family transcriptional regulator for hemolysin